MDVTFPVRGTDAVTERNSAGWGVCVMTQDAGERDVDGMVIFDVTAGWRFWKVVWLWRRAMAVALVVLGGKGVRVVDLWVERRTGLR